MNTQYPSNKPPYFNPGEDEPIDFKRYISLFVSNWYWFAISLFIALSIAYGINRWSEKVYTVSSSLLIKDDKFGGSGTDLANIFPGTNAFKSQQNLKNEIGILKSFNLNYKVMQELPEFYINYVQVGKRGIAETRMYKSCPFKVVYNSLEQQSIGQIVEIRIISDLKYILRINGGTNFEKELTFGENFNEMGFNFIIRKSQDRIFFESEASNKYYFNFIDLTSLANSYRDKLGVAPIDEDASLVTLTTSGFVPDQEADYLNMLMDKYLQYGLEFKNLNASQTINFIENQLVTISDSLKIAERDLESFRLYNNLIDISREGSIIQGKLAQIDEEKTKLLLQKSYYQYLKDYIESKRDGDIVAPSAMGVSDQLMIRLVTEYSELQLQKKELGMNLEESMEPMRMIEANIAINRSSIVENINDGFTNIENSISDVNLRLAKIDQEIRKLPSTERQMINIQRKFDINNAVYTFLLEKRAEAGIAKASNVPDNRIIDYAGAFNSSRIEPKERKNLMSALLLGLLIPFIGIVLIDFLSNKIIDKKDIEKGTSVPVIGFISHNNLNTETPVFEKPGSTLSESFRSVRTSLKYFLKDIKCPVISISSTITSEGKTFISANLASIIALSDNKVLLVGLDLRKPRIHKIFGLDNKYGITNYLIGEAEFDEIIIKTEFKNLWFTPTGPVPPNPAELIESPIMSEFIRKAKEKFDFILIDTPPVAIVTDALLVTSFTDLYIFVIRQRYSSKNTLGLIEELHKNENLKNLGIIINDINISGYYGYGLRYGYSMGSGYNYGYNYYGHDYYGKSDNKNGYYVEE